jgi:DnaJ family protein C protein 25
MHPDKMRLRSEAERKAANDAFTTVTAANDALKTRQKRLNYNYYLDHPEDRGNGWDDVVRRYYAKTSLWKVLLGFFLPLSTLIYYVQIQRYKTAVRYFRRRKDVVMKAKSEAIARRQKRAAEASRVPGAVPGRRRKKQASVDTPSVAEVDAILDEMFEGVEIEGGYRKPVLFEWRGWRALPRTDVLIVRMLLHWPVATVSFLAWAGRWVVMFWLLRRPYGSEERTYLTRTALRMKADLWERRRAADPEWASAQVARELWTPVGMAAYQREREEEFKRAHPKKWKQYQRFKRQEARGGR